MGLRGSTSDHPLRYFALCLTMLCAWYASFALLAPYGAMQLLTLIPFWAMLMSAVKVARSSFVARCAERCCYFDRVVRFIGGLTLEIYLTHRLIINFNLTEYFPLNLPPLWLGVIATAYIARILTRILIQTIASDEAYNWRSICAIS